VAEEIRFPIVGEDRGATRVLKDVGRESAVTAAQARLLAESLAKEQRAASSVTDALLKVEKAATLVAITERKLDEEARRAELAMRGEADAAQKLGRASGDAAGKGGIASLIGSGGGGGGGMLGVGAAAGLVLGPVLAVAGVGLGGLAVAALSAGRNSKALRAELVPLRTDFASFQKQLQPVLLADFAQAAGAARTGLHLLEPAAAGAGKALSSVFSSLGAEFRSPEFTSFFEFVAREAGPDVRLLGNDFIQLMKILPPVVQAMHGVSVEALNDVSGIFKLIGAVEKLVAEQHHLQDEAAHSSGWMGRLAHAVGDAFNRINPGAPLFKKVADELAKWGKEGQSAAGAARITGAAALTAAGELKQMATWTTNLMNAENTALNVQTTYAGDLVTTASDARTLEKALKGSRGEIGLHTAAQRASFGAANTYITDLGNTAVAAYKSGHGVDAAITAIRKGLPILDQAKTKNRAYWGEVKTLTGWLDKLRLEKAIHETVFVTGSGTFTVRPGTSLGLPGGSAGGPFAAGGRITAGTGPTADDVLIRASRDETVVSAAHSRILAPAFKALGVPGYAAGGLLGSYGGSVAGLVPWSRNDLNATVHIFERSMASAVLAGMRQAAQTFAGGLGRAGLRWLENLWMGAGGPGGGTAHVAGAIALAESGGRANAYNASGASGLWQILGQVVPGNIFDPHINALNAVSKYRSAGGFSPWVTFETGAYQQFMDQGGWLHPGWNPPMYNGTGRMEHLVPAGGAGGDTYVTVNVQVGHGTSPRQAAKELVDILNQGATAGYKLRRSILSANG
jgi:Lysozyme like domain